MYPLLNSPIHVGKIEVKNRLILPPLATERTADGKVNEDILAYYGKYANGGNIGIIVVEHSYISEEGAISPRQLSCASDEDVEGLQRLAFLLKRNGSKAFIQINHGGSAGKPRKYEEQGVQKVSSEHLLAPSAVPHPNRTWDAGTPHALTAEEIDTIVQKFASAARRTREAGFDGVVIHGAHGYLLNQFFCPLSNKREDRYGGSFEKRIRMHLDVLRAVKDAAGDMVVSMRLGCCDYVEGGGTLEEAVEAAVLCEREGADMLDISGGMNGFTHPTSKEAGWFAEMTRPIKQRVSVPVVLTGGITEPEQAERLLENGVADCIGVGRALMQNPYWADEKIAAMS